MDRIKYLLLLCLFSAPPMDCSDDENGYFMFADFKCAVSSRDPEQVEYLVDWYFNGGLTMRYNSTVGDWTGLTPAGRVTASLLNGNKGDRRQRQVERQQICVDNVPLMFNVTDGNEAKPSVGLREADLGAGSDATLVCSAYDFYPKHIRMTWRRGGQEVTEGVSFSEVLTNGDWTYQAHSFLELKSGRRDGVSCVVEHASLREPKISDWDFSSDHTGRSHITGGVCALLLGAVFLSAGLIRYRKTSGDYIFSKISSWRS
ncbi:SLA class II histocompatibility antigen, DQ haplotype D beta chain-like [Embiotoca jacksoni]|uniref:SLA class II histocompatibility antigen, DQ haplotype D beta chain-like n=1 Tax=Embiotoca jacksoni TaxID=100190 RepID=UPI003704390F